MVTATDLFLAVVIGALIGGAFLSTIFGLDKLQEEVEPASDD